MPQLTTIQQIAIWIIPVLLAITLHEAAHAYVAYYFGDNTAKHLGRLSLNPIKHVDIFGTFIVPIVVLFLSNFTFVFGWAKPVPVTTKNLHNPRRDLALVTFAGPLINLFMAFLWALLFKLALYLDPVQSVFALFLIFTARAGMIINLLFAFFNLLPIPPMDGSKIVMSLLPPRIALGFEKIEPFGVFIVLALLITGMLGWILDPLMNWSLQFLVKLFNL